MPKEITHLLVAERTAERLRGTCLGDSAFGCPNALKMGAVFLDIPYYLTGTSKLAEMAAMVANEYHGTHGEDTYVLLRTLLAWSSKHVHPAHQAFLTGVISHLQTDMVFHPCIFFMTGNYHDTDPVKRTRAVRDHRRFEVMLDFHVCRVLGQKPQNFKARKFWKNLECQQLLGWSEEDKERPELGIMLKMAVKKFMTAQGLFPNSVASLIADVFDPILPDTLKELTALFYRHPPEYLMARLSGSLEYQNPMSGEICLARVDELLEQAVEKSIALCKWLESFLANGNSEYFAERGPSLNFGIIGADISLARYFAIPSFFDSYEER